MADTQAAGAANAIAACCPARRFGQESQQHASVVPVPAPAQAGLADCLASSGCSCQHNNGLCSH